MLKGNSYRVFHMVYLKVICIHLIDTFFEGIFNPKVLLLPTELTASIPLEKLKLIAFSDIPKLFQIFSFCLKRLVVTKQFRMNLHSRESCSSYFVLNFSALITQVVYLDEHTAWLREWNHRFRTNAMMNKPK